MKTATIEAGHVGLVSGVSLADFGHDVACVDRLPEKIAMLERCEVPISEPGLDTVMTRNPASGRLCFTTDLAAAIDGADAIVIAVGIPTRRGDGHAGLRSVYNTQQALRSAFAAYMEVGR